MLSVAAMLALLKKTLKVVPGPLVTGAVPIAPSALEALNPTVECKCGNCGAVLMVGIKVRPTLSNVLSTIENAPMLQTTAKR
jgi:hypothetical protein